MRISIATTCFTYNVPYTNPST
ncbi:hypothetical protein NC651_009629 [Populus alba x Populus x berolinensis]|nr:hypothetical protein NC651_009629 [Populus alba x Populus x berolinensis]